MKKPFRRIIAQVLTVIFIMIILSPLAPIAMSSSSVAPLVAGECSGDCDVCGCSLERRATHTCCCWQKKNKLLMEEKEHSQEVPSCCNFKKALQSKIQKKIVSIKSNCPCERNKLNAIFGSVESPLITCRMVEINPVYTEHSITNYLQQRMMERHDDPPDPPPKLTIYS